MIKLPALATFGTPSSDPAKPTASAKGVILKRGFMSAMLPCEPGHSGAKTLGRRCTDERCVMDCEYVALSSRTLPPGMTRLPFSDAVRAGETPTSSAGSGSTPKRCARRRMLPMKRDC